MGDRANIAVLQNGTDQEAVYLYTHWGGYDLPETLRQALLKNWRWDDPQYLARIILNEMQGDLRNETGFGISTKICDNSYPILVVDCVNQKVWQASERDLFQVFGEKVTFEDYLKMEPKWNDQD